MKHLLATTTILALSAGFASAAEVTLSGDARMGIIDSYDLGLDRNDTQFTSRARVKFTLSGETDGGLSFGASFRADNAGDAASGTAGEVSISGAFGTLSMGDVNGAAQAMVGQVSGVGLTSLGTFNEITYLGSGDPTVLYTYSAGALSLAASIGQIDADEDFDGNSVQAYSVGAAYTTGDYKFSAGYEVGNKAIYSFRDRARAYDPDPEDTYWDRFDLQEHLVLGADATFGAISVKARLGMATGESYSAYPVDGLQYALSGTYTTGPLALTAFVAGSDVTFNWEDDTDYGFTTKRYGIGAAYDLGGGASVMGGISQLDSETTGIGYGDKYSDKKFDLGFSFSF